ncbi:MAG: nitroreductase [Chloroflexi bacterium]|nr:nitroreductase [Chloroflexota bacterium]
MELLEGIETRRTWRAFKKTAIPVEVLRKVLRAAGNSPSYTNTQPWEVAVVTGKKKEELRDVLYDLAQSETTANPDIVSPRNWPAELERRAREHGARRYQAIGVDRENRQQRNELRLINFEFYGAPCVLFFFLDSALGEWSVFDSGLFAENVILAAHSVGLGCCLQAALASYPDAVRQFLGIPKTKRLIIGMSMGYPAPEAKINSYHSQKIGLDDFVKWYG